MLDFFYILTKGGFVLWCLPSAATKFLDIINNAIDTAILQGQSNAQKWLSNVSPHHIHYKLDNEFEIIFILGYQKTLNISYADQFLDEIQKRFYDRYKNDLVTGSFHRPFPFRLSYEEILFKMKEEEKENQETSEKPNQPNLPRSIAIPRPKLGYLQTITIPSSTNTSLWSKLSKMNVFLSKILTSEDLQSGMEIMREYLIAKNVAAEIAEQICQSVSSKLTGTTLETFGNLTTNIRQAMRETLMMILTPKRQTDILRDIVDTQQAHRPYVITFCGVNGVGKSTNLAKVAYWLCRNNFRVLIAGCDTFRSGAIEQLRTHVYHLNQIFNEKSMIELYERGYGKDPAGIAMQAIHFAKMKQFDVVLIDTAGRMENDKPLMKVLAKLIYNNNPDLILFVGEALAGNSAVDQVTQFNQALTDNTPLQRNSRTIDGIILTKFDAVDDKAGAVISMTYTIDKPIVFVGTGQQREDLKMINADILIETLLK